MKLDTAFRKSISPFGYRIFKQLRLFI